jgi:hypothetical protein
MTTTHSFSHTKSDCKYHVEGSGLHQRQGCDLIARNYMGRRRNFKRQHFWARGYDVPTLGIDEAVIREYILSGPHFQATGFAVVYDSANNRWIPSESILSFDLNGLSPDAP